MESVSGELPYRAEDYIVIPRGITYQAPTGKELKRKIISF